MKCERKDANELSKHSWSSKYKYLYRKWENYVTKLDKEIRKVRGKITKMDKVCSH